MSARHVVSAVLLLVIAAGLLTAQTVFMALGTTFSVCADDRHPDRLGSAHYPRSRLLPPAACGEGRAANGLIYKLRKAQSNHPCAARPQVSVDWQEAEP